MKQLRHIAKSQTLLINEQSRLLETKGRTIYKFGFGQSPFSPPDFVTEVLQKDAGQHDYTPVQGIAPLRSAVAEFHSKFHAIDISPESVFIGPGSKTLIYCILACFDAAEVFLPAPAWVSYEPQATMLHHFVNWIPTRYDQRWRLTPDLLDAALKNRKRPDAPAIMVLNYPGNPEGLSYSSEELEALAVILKKHEVLVISDEIYGLLDHEGEHSTLATHYPEGTIITTGLSKWAGAGGWRLGIAILPETIAPSFKETLLGVASEVYSCAPTPVQLAATEAYAQYDKTMAFVAHERRILKLLGNAVQGMLVDSELQVHEPMGGFYLFVDFMPLQARLAKRGIDSSDALCEALLKEAGVVLLPSTAFGVPPNYLSARLAYVDFDGKAALAASEKLGLEHELPESFLTDYCRPVMEGIGALCEWAHDAAAGKSVNHAG